MKKLMLLLAVLMSVSTNVFAEKVSLPAYWNKTSTHIWLETTDSESFYRYENSRFFFHTYIPSCMSKAAVPVNGDGAIFSNKEETAFFWASGGYNSSYKKSAKEYLDENIKSIGVATVTYSDYGNSWYVISGVKNAQVYYIKGLVGNVTQSAIRLIYPYAQKENYDWMIPILERHFYQEDRAL